MKEIRFIVTPEEGKEEVVREVLNRLNYVKVEAKPC